MHICTSSRARLAEAEQQYQLALKEKPDDLPALLGYAQLKEYLGKPDEAIQLYQRAAKAYPQQASVHNNLGLCYARQNRLDEAVAAMSHAISWTPRIRCTATTSPRVLVDQGTVRRGVCAPAGSTRRRGGILQHGLPAEQEGPDAGGHAALRAGAEGRSVDGRGAAVDRVLAEDDGAGPVAAASDAAGVRITSQPAMPPEDEFGPPDEPPPQRLPPTTLRPPPADGPTLPGISYEARAAATAPLPPAPTKLRPAAAAAGELTRRERRRARRAERGG